MWLNMSRSSPPPRSRGIYQQDGLPLCFNFILIKSHALRMTTYTWSKHELVAWLNNWQSMYLENPLIINGTIMWGGKFLQSESPPPHLPTSYISLSRLHGANTTSRVLSNSVNFFRANPHHHTSPRLTSHYLDSIGLIEHLEFFQIRLSGTWDKAPWELYETSYGLRTIFKENSVGHGI